MSDSAVSVSRRVDEHGVSTTPTAARTLLSLSHLNQFDCNMQTRSYCRLATRTSVGALHSLSMRAGIATRTAVHASTTAARTWHGHARL